MRLVDDTGRLIRAPEVRFSSSEIGLDAFGYNIENHLLVGALEARAAELAHLVRLDDEAETITPAEADTAIRSRQGKKPAPRRLRALRGGLRRMPAAPSAPHRAMPEGLSRLSERPSEIFTPNAATTLSSARVCAMSASIASWTSLLPAGLPFAII